MSKSVFISHAVKDKALAAGIVDLIENGMGVPENEIFCSSLDGYGIPSGKNFVTYIREQLLDPKIVVLILTPAYFESKFCLSELGAAWVKSHNIFPVLVPPLEYKDVKDVLLGTQVAKIDDDIKYNELLDALKNSLKFVPKSQTKWDVKRRSFLRALEPLLKKVEGPSVVSATEYQAKVAELAEAVEELDTLEAEARLLKQRLAETEALKDKDAVESVAKKFQDSDLADELAKLAEGIKVFRGKFQSRAVFKFFLSEHYRKPYTIDWMNDREDFERAARFGFIDAEDETPIWSKPTMKGFSKKLDALDTFLRVNLEELQEGGDEDIPLDSSAQDFWEYFYEI